MVSFGCGTPSRETDLKGTGGTYTSGTMYHGGMTYHCDTTYHGGTTYYGGMYPGGEYPNQMSICFAKNVGAIDAEQSQCNGSQCNSSRCNSSRRQGSRRQGSRRHCSTSRQWSTNLPYSNVIVLLRTMYQPVHGTK